MTAEQERLQQNATHEVPLETWGPYLSERQWGTVREDYSENGDAWNYFPHDHARSRVYRWGEDGLAGISDYRQQLCFAVALWNGKDPILKERLFGLTNNEGNHGEDVKELYYYLDNLPSHYYMQYLYKYPQQAFPYEDLINTNKSRSKFEEEYELLDTGIFNQDAYFDVAVTYAKQNSEDICIRIDVVNKGNNTAAIAVLPTLWFFNKWQFGQMQQKPQLQWINGQTVKASHEDLGDYYFYVQEPQAILFTENETNTERLFGRPNSTPFVKDAFHDAVIHGRNKELLMQQRNGTKCAALYELVIPPGATESLYARITRAPHENPFSADFAKLFAQRLQEADDFYRSVLPPQTDSATALLQRQAFASLLWNKQYYHYDVEDWLALSDGISPAAAARQQGRNAGWKNIKNADVILMPDKWEYPWYAAWDLAFHCIPMAIIDPQFAKHQLILLTREWYMNPNGQMPAYEWNFSDVNPPVQAFAALQVYEIEKRKTGKGDTIFLKKIFQKLVVNFTWWVNRKDLNGNNIFSGGFLGLDNIGVFNRSSQLPDEVELEQTDATAWMAMYALHLFDMAVEIAAEDPAFEDMATKFYEHFVLIADAANRLGLWDEADQFFYDVLSLYGKAPIALKLRSVVGLVPLFAVSMLTKEQCNRLPGFAKRMDWFNRYEETIHHYKAYAERKDPDTLLFSLVDTGKLTALLARLLNETEFLSPGGIRALSKYYKDHPYRVNIAGSDYEVSYDPGDSTSGLFGGNSNWRGPVWMPINYLLVKSIEKYGAFYGNDLHVEFPQHSGNFMDLQTIAAQLRERLIRIFTRDADGKRPVHGRHHWFYERPGNEELVLFYEYFHGDDSHGVGASHQTGWTALIADMLF
jgi:hypothetical protein